MTPVMMVVLWALLLFIMMAACGRGHSHGHHASKERVPEAVPPTDQERDLGDVIRATGRRSIGKVVAIEGDLLKAPDEAYRALQSRFAGTDLLPTLQRNEFGKPSVMLFPRAAFAGRVSKDKPWLNVLLLVATFGTTTWAGAAHQGINVLDEPARIFSGLPYALALMLILGIHEMGHYAAARIHKMNVSLPYFIPAPFGLGTFGAFIQLREPSANRRALFDVGVAGPLAGLVATLAALVVGLRYSEVLPAQEQGVAAAHHGAEIGTSVLFTAIAKFSLGAQLAEGHRLALHPLAFAGWLGLLVTALNLLPIGQLDGGHVADAMFGPRAGAAISTAGIVVLFGLAFFVWSGLLMWAVIIYFMAGRKSFPPLNDLTRLDGGRMAIGWFSFVLLLLILTPVPHALFENLGINCPYL
jgi:Zn-dependent protease